MIKCELNGVYSLFALNKKVQPQKGFPEKILPLGPIASMGPCVYISRPTFTIKKKPQQLNLVGGFNPVEKSCWSNWT